MQRLDAATEDAIRRIVEDEGWDRPPAPVERIRPSGWYTAAFWLLRLYVGAMLAVVTYAFAHGVH
jgi:hypothetical protein